MSRLLECRIAFARFATTLVAASLLAGLLPPSAWSQDESAATGETARDESDDRTASRFHAIAAKSVDYWVEQLGHEHYLRREMASKRLIAAGADAVDSLALAARSGDLEVVERAAEALTHIAVSNPPQADGGAFDRLDELAKQTVGRPASSAKSAMFQVRQERLGQAREALAKAGISVGMNEFAIGAISHDRMVVQIGEAWNGDQDALQWLEWLSGVDNARVTGEAVIPVVMQRVAQIPGIKSIAVVDATIVDEALEPLTQMQRIDTIDFRYVRLSDGQGDMISEIPLRVSLNLMGTGISPQKVESMRSALPGLKIEHRRGGFLGVTCIDNFDECEINGILHDSAAEVAGLIKGDIIVQIEDNEIRHFRDLQNAINQHIPGDEIEVQYRRGDKVESVKLKLRRFEES